jgi:hypothetical protein
MRKRVYAGMTLAALFSGQALANEKLTLVLDWYINPTMRRLWWPNRLAPLKRGAGRQDCPAVRPGAAAGWWPPAGGPGDHLPAAGALFR